MQRCKLLVFILSICLILGMTPNFVVEAASNGVINGTVVNLTPGGSPVSGLTAALYTYENSNILNVVSALIADDGAFSFNGISTDSVFKYEVVVDFKQVEYPSDILQFETAETVKTIVINVFETTQNDSGIKINLAHTVISFLDGSLDFTEVINFENSGDRTYIGSQPAGTSDHYEVLKFSLPPNAANLTPSSGLSENYMVATTNGFADISPIAPGSKPVGYAYTVTATDTTYNYTRTANYAMDELKILIKGDAIVFSGAGFTQADPLNMGGVSYSYYYKQNIAAGDTISYKLSGLAAASSGSSNATTTLLIIVIAVVVAGILVFVLVMQSRKKPPVTDEEE